MQFQLSAKSKQFHTQLLDLRIYSILSSQPFRSQSKMERMVVPAIELIWRKVVESFSSRMVDQMADNALDSVKNIADFEPIFQNLKKNLKSLSARAADVEEEMTNLEASGRKKRKREVEEWLEDVESIKQEVVELGSQVESEGFVTRLTDGGKATQLNERVNELVEQSRNFGELVLDVRRTSGDTFLTEGLVGQAFNKNLGTILRLLESRQVSSIGVYGMGGVGKTTLAKHINNQLIQRSGGCVFWVTVSQEYNVRGLQDKIARLLGVDLSHEDEVGKRAMRLHRALSGKKNSVLILDDVWEYIDMKKVGCLFAEDGCRLIITTRSLEVCRRIGCQREIPVKMLHAGEAWKLFKETLGTQIELDPEVEGIAKAMIKLCGGLPLGIITVAGSMRGKRGSHRWRHNFLELQERVKGKDSMGEDEDEVFDVLRFSFDRLKKRSDKSNEFSVKQLCFLYCSLYPEDYEIEKKDLVRKFISERLVSERESRRARVDQGHSILDELVDVCLLESCLDEEGEECVKMHDLVRSMALRICKGKYLVRAGDYSLEEISDQEEWTEDLEKVSIMHNLLKRIEDGISPNCPNVSTLLLSGRNWLEVIPESFFSRMHGLRTLDLCYTEISKLPNSVSDLTCLRALLLKECNQLEGVPYLGKLKELRELDLSDTAIKEVPQGLEVLLKLEFLSLNAFNLEMLPSELLLKLVHLQHVSFPFHLRAPVEGIQNLKLLEEFFGSVDYVEYFNCFNGSGVSLLEYTIIVGQEEERDSFEDSYYKKNLALFGCNLEEQTVLGHDSEYVIISKCEGLSISFLDYFPKIKKLQIDRCGGIDCIVRSDRQGSPGITCTLEEIELEELDYLEGVVMQREEIGTSTAPIQVVFSSLTSIRIVCCDNMRKVGLPASGVPNLEEIVIEWCSEIEEIFEVGEGRNYVITLPKLKNLTLFRLSRLKKVGLPVSGVLNLEEIAIEGCREIEEIFEVDEGRDIAITLPKLKKLKLSELARLKKVGFPATGAPNLEEIVILGCAEIEEIFEVEEGRDSVINLPKLRKLTLWGLERLKKVGLPVSGVPNLEEIAIIGCREIEEIFEEDEGRVVSKLREMILDDLPRLKRVSKTTIISDSITTIRIRKCPILMKKLPLHMDDRPPTTLQRIFVEKEWWELLEWDTNSNPNLPQLLLPLLQFL